MSEGAKKVRITREPVPVVAPALPTGGECPASSPRRGRSRVVTVSAKEIARCLPPLNYVVSALGIASGPPTCVGGYGDSKKTMAMMDLLLSVASGKPFLGVHRVARGKAIHLDFEQGERITHTRYQRIARGKGVDLASLGDALTLATFPQLYLDDRSAESELVELVVGFDVCLIDSFRAAAPGVDENKSDARKPLDMLARVSERTGCAFIVLMHTRKPSANAGGEGEEAKHTLRGSGALFDACQSVFMFQSTKNGPTRVSHEKCRSRGKTGPDFGIDVEDVEIDGDRVAGLRVVHLAPEQLDGPRATSKPTDAHAVRVRAFLESRGGTYLGSKETLRMDMGCASEVSRMGTSVLEARGELTVERKPGGGVVMRLVGGAPSAHMTMPASLGEGAPGGVGATTRLADQTEPTPARLGRKAPPTRTDSPPSTAD